ncbi:MAG: cobaltochelatase subunit CobN [Candidatus Methanoperedenaceae archaeon]|nr:cobaltochelatase subunit CobN [Candidatus Methanoperedenaceae archaeon]
MKKIASIMWNSYVPMLIKANQNVGFELSVFSSKNMEENPDIVEKAMQAFEEADLILLYRTSDLFWDGIETKLKELGKRIPIVCAGYDPSYWMLSTVKPGIVANSHSYLTINGEENLKNLLLYLGKEVLGLNLKAEPPRQVAWEGLYHPDAPKHFENIKDYLEWYKPKTAPAVGILFSRISWINHSLDIENTLIRELEKRGLNVIPAFSYSVKDDELGSKGMGEIVREYFLENDKAGIDALIKLIPFFLGQNRGNMRETGTASSGVELLKILNVPVFQPIISTYKTLEEWESSNGLSNDIGWSVAMPEFEGVIEPMIIGANSLNVDYMQRLPIEDRCAKLAQRVMKWVTLKGKPVEERKVAFILHNNPCAGVELGVGGAAHLDSLESVARILTMMKEAGYNVSSPASGKELIDNIMEKKALSEFRWTPIQEIVKHGGALAMIKKEEYETWFNTLSTKVRDRLTEAWGAPPGEEKNGIPAAMVFENKIVVTGVRYGNAVVCIQPKRGCAGSRCDGQVCKILHDPDVPPTHQYLATYRYLEDTWGADVLVHVGTHGNLEFLPGKGVGLSGDCYPDIAIGTIPHLYIYNADNPPEGTIAKRRSYATLVDHMQTVMTQGGLYEELEELERLLGEYETAKHDMGRAHALEHLILDSITKSKLDKEIKLSEDMSLENIVSKAHEALGRIRNTQINSGMHIFGELPQGDKRVEFINSILRYDSGGISLRRTIAGIMGLNFDGLLANLGEMSNTYKKSNGELLEDIDNISKVLIKEFLANDGKNYEDIFEKPVEQEYESQLESLRERVLDLNNRTDESKEIEALLSGFDGKYIPAGPSGLITRGRDDVLPTGRNFYSLDPHRVPTRAAWKVGQKLAHAVIDKYKKEEGRLPENVAFYWMSNDIMWADGEGMSQMMYLLGVEPVWYSNGRIKGFEVIPPEKLGRPRIDVTIRVSGITRDNFPNCIELIDEAIQAVASLDEPLDMNYPRKHSLAQMTSDTGNAQDDWRNATLRIFASKPGTYQAGVQLAVYASAWKEEKDLSDIFVYWNGYAYGKGVNGKESHQQLVNSLRTVDTTFNKVVSDEYDLFGCCCYFGTHGGMTAAARSISGKEVKSYYGDTREPEHVEVRDLADEIRRIARTKILNPKWIEGMKQHGYKGAGDIAKRVGRVYGWEAATKEVDDWIFDDIAKTFVLDEEMKKFFEDNNPYALEEIARRLLEANQRELWDADPEVLEGLKNTYLEIEGWMEERAGEGEFQGGAIDIKTALEVESWGKKMKAVMEKLHNTT